MSSVARPALDPDEVIVRAEYFLPIDPTESNLTKIKSDLRLIIEQRGYVQIDPDLSILGPSYRSMTFFPEFEQKKPPLARRVKAALGLNQDGDVPMYQRKHFLERIEYRREDLPFEIEIQLRTVDSDESRGYMATVVVIPTLLQQYRQRILTEDSDFDVKTTVKTVKRTIERVFSKIEAHPIQEPYTEAEIIEPNIGRDQRNALSKSEYGETALQYLNEGDVCLQNGLLNAALNCYVLAIEWTIITHLKREGRRDVIEEEKEKGGEYYWELVAELENDRQVSQKSYEKLSNLNSVERTWMAHHKSGDLAESDVKNVRDRLGILVRELFPRSDQD